MQRLTIHLKKFKKEYRDGKQYVKNTLSFRVADEYEAQEIVNSMNQSSKNRNNIKKWYLSNIK